MPTNVGGISVSIKLDDREAIQQLAKVRQKGEELNNEINQKTAKKDALTEQLQAAEKESEGLSNALTEAADKVSALGAEMAKGEPSARLVEAQEQSDTLAAILTRAFNKVSEIEDAIDNGPPKDQMRDYQERLKEANAELKEAEAAYTEQRKVIEKIKGEDLADYNSRLKEANAELKQAETAYNAQQKNIEKIRSELESTTGSLEKDQARLESLNNQADMLEKQALASKSATAKLQNAVKQAAASMEKGFQRVGRMVKRVFVFTVILRALRALREYFSDIFMSVPEFNQALSELKGNLLTAIQPLLDRAIPALVRLVSILRDVAAVLADIVSRVFGTTAAASQASAKTINEQAEAYKNAGKSASKASKQLASFDQLNILSTSGSGSSSTAAASFNTDFEGLLGEKLKALELLVGEALLVIGTILAFSGINIPLGITLMAIGAASIYSSVRGNWNELKKQMEGTIGKIFTLVSVASLVLGAILTFSGVNLPLGIALMLIGAAGLTTMAALNWEKIVTALQGPIGKIVAIAFGALIALGLILTLSGASVPLGIALIIAGAAGLGTVMGLNWDKIVTAIQGPIGKIAAIASGALLALGIILVASGVALPLGIALIIAGATGLFTVGALNWNAIKQKVAGVWSGIVQWWKTEVAPVFTKEWWNETLSVVGDAVTDMINDATKKLKTFFAWVSGTNLGTTVNEHGSSHSSGSFLTYDAYMNSVTAGTAIPTSGDFLASLAGYSAPGSSSGSGTAAAIEAVGDKVAAAISKMQLSANIDGEKITAKVKQNLNKDARAGGKAVIVG